jgi:hypothetical protein
MRTADEGQQFDVAGGVELVADRVRLPVGPIPEEFVDTTSSALHGYLTDRQQVSLVGWR